MVKEAPLACGSGAKTLPLELDGLPPQPVVSVLMVNFNYATFIGEAIESVLRQSYPHIELVICDDGSIDESWVVIQAYQRCDPRIRAVRHSQNKGMAAALNTAFAASTGHIVTLIDSDDLYLQDKVERVVAAFLANPDSGLVIHPLQMVDRHTHTVSHPYFRTRTESGWIRDRVIARGGRWSHVPGGGLCLRRTIAEHLFPIPEPEFRRFADGFLYTLAPLLTPVTTIHEPLYLYRLHGDNDTANLLRDRVTAERLQEGLETQIAGVNARLKALGAAMPTLDPAANLNLVQQRFVLAAFDGTGPIRMIRPFLQVARQLLTDDLYFRKECAARLIVYAVALALPPRLRGFWLQFARSPSATLASIRERWIEQLARAWTSRGAHGRRAICGLPCPAAVASGGETDQTAARRPLALRELPADPLVSILIANHNYAPFIGTAIQSALDQTYRHLEIVICDDGSTDHSCTVIDGFAQRDTRVRLVRLETNQGMAAALNAAYAASSGDIVCLLDADDTYDPRKLELVVRCFREQPRAGLALHRLLMVDAELRPIQEIPYLGRFETGWIADRLVRRGGRWRDMPGGAIALRREAAELAFPIPETFRRAADGFIFTLLPLLTEVVALDDVLYYYRIHGANDYAAHMQSPSGLRAQMSFIEQQVGAVNRRLDELSAPGPRLDATRHLTLAQNRLALQLLEPRPRAELAIGYLGFAKALLRDDLHRPLQKLLGLIVFGGAIALPASTRGWWLARLLGPARHKMVLRRLLGARRQPRRVAAS